MARRTRRTIAQTLTEACQRLLKDLEHDLRASLEDPLPGESGRREEFRAEWKRAKDEGRTSKSFKLWLDDLVTQVGASWILSCVFVRFAEDNSLIDPPRIAGPVDEDPSQGRHQRARDAEKAYYDRHPTADAREYLKSVFEELLDLPGFDEILDQRHALLWRLNPTIEGGRRLLEFFRQLDDATGELRWDFTDPELDTRFLGDLYQDLSESARKDYALLQTPAFVETFILDRTLEPAIDTFGLGEVRLIDPTCGSGHFLLGAFQRLFAHWQRAEPGTDPIDLARRALDAVHGVDLNPFAVAIARFRLLVAALRACGARRLKDAPDFRVHVAVGDSLWHGPRFSGQRGKFVQFAAEFSLGHLYPHELSADLRRILGQQYHVVVGNPPYITPKDSALNRAYRLRFESCSGKYALSVPFMERFVELALPTEGGRPAGYVGKITANSFIKREFGKKLIEEFFKQWDLTHLIDTSGAYIPGHGTPTVILFLRNQGPSSPEVRAVLGIRGEPSTPPDPAKGLVWSAIVDQVDRVGSESKFISVEEIPREELKEHPWCMGGGGARDLLKRMRACARIESPAIAAGGCSSAAAEERTDRSLGSVVESIGITCFTLEDDVFIRPQSCWLRSGPAIPTRPIVEGDAVRDWVSSGHDHAVFPYGNKLLYEEGSLGGPGVQVLWPYRARLQSNKLFGGLRKASGGVGDYEYGRLTAVKLRTPLSIAYAEIATHNHFVLDRGGKVFKQTAPVIKLPPDATEDDHFALLAILNSSTAAFWGKQVLFPKGGDPVGGEGARVRPNAWEERFVWNATNLEAFPLVEHNQGWRAERLDQLARHLAGSSPAALVSSWSSPQAMGESEQALSALLGRMIAEQEELDWAVYGAYGLGADDLVLEDLGGVPPLALGERAFELVMARGLASGDADATWFERHGSRPITELPSHWPPAYRLLVERRVARIQSDRNLGLLERPEHKRRWNVEPWQKQVERALDQALLDRIEALPEWRGPRAVAVGLGHLTERMEGDERFMALLRLREGDQAPDVGRALAQLVQREGVPFLPVLYLKPLGLRKRADWEETWRLQRIEDPFLDEQERILREHFGERPVDQKKARQHVALWLTGERLTRDKTLEMPSGDPKLELARLEKLAALEALRTEWRAIDACRKEAVGGPTPPVPPKYTSADFLGGAWGLRGKLDVPKERFISYPHCAPDGEEGPLIGWAGWDHAQRASALVQVLEARKAEGWSGERLAPMLQGLDQLLPWLGQWHGKDHEDQYRAFVESEALTAGLRLEDLRNWRPTQAAPRRGRRQSTTRRA